VLDGAIRISTVSEAGHDVVLTRIEAYRWFGEIALIDGDARTHDADADGSATLLHVPRGDVEALLAVRPAYWRDLARLTSSTLRFAFVALEDVGVVAPAVRVARRLALLVETRSAASAEPVVRISQERIAAMLGLSRQTINRELKGLERAGVLRAGYGQIAIADLDALYALAQWRP
jgi:CRP-like cAMP-binding protein